MKMFWKHREKDDNGTMTVEKPPPVKRKEMSPKEEMGYKIRQLGATDCLSYRLDKSYAGGDRLAIVELDQQANGKKKQYQLNIDMLVNEKPAGAKICVMKSENPDEIVGWIHKRRIKNQS
jgi:hypothetical protein